MKIDRRTYASHYGPTTGDRIRLADTDLVIAALLLTGLSEELRQLKNLTGGQDLRPIAYALLLILMMLLRPEGTFPSRQRQAELHAGQPAEGPTPVQAG